MGKIAITTTFGKYDERPLKLLEEYGLEVVLNPYGRTLKKDEVIEFCKGAIGVIAGTEILDIDTLECLTKTYSQTSVLRPQSLKVISRCGSGLANVDLDTAKRLGIKVFNTPDAPIVAVAELTVGLILNLLRKVCWMDRNLRNEQWEKMMGNLLNKKKVGIKGLGRIGKKVAELLRPFGCEIAYADPYVSDGLLGMKRLSFDDLLGWADIITLHASVDETDCNNADEKNGNTRRHSRYGLLSGE